MPRAGEHRSTQRRIPRGRDDEQQLTEDIVALARRFGRYGYPKIAELLRNQAGWVVNDKRVERIWRQEGLKVPAKQPTDPEKANYAFFGRDPEGSGVEVWFSEYEIFALLIGTKFMEHGWTQGTTVSVLREIRPVLEPEHGKILEWETRDASHEEKGATV